MVSTFSAGLLGRPVVRAEPERYHAALERFAGLHAGTMRRAGAGVIDLSFPNPQATRDPRAMEALRRAAADVSQSDLQYTPFGGRTVPRRRVAAALSRRFGVRLGFRDILLTPGATAALSLAFAALFEPGDEVVMVTPGWMDYPLYLERLGVRVVQVPSGPDKRIDPAAVAAGCSAGTAGVIISQPACPSGVLHTRQELQALADVLAAAAEVSGRDIVLVSDEVHRDQVWDGAAVTSPMELHPHTVSVYSFGKAWSLQGQRTGYLALGPGLQSSTVYTALDRALRSTGVCAPTALMQQVVTEIADLQPDQSLLRADQLHMRRLLVERGFDVVPGQGTAFVYVRCPDGDDWAFVDRVAQAGVLAMPSSVFHEPGHFRLALNVNAHLFDDVVSRIGVARHASRAMPA